MRYFISVDYVEPNQKEYKSVNLSESYGDRKWSFNTGDFVKDWFNMIKHIITKTTDETFYATYSSSVDHFIMDGKAYDSAYLCFEDDGTPYLDYEDIDGIELFVKADTKLTWKELEEICK